MIYVVLHHALYIFDTKEIICTMMINKLNGGKSMSIIHFFQTIRFRIILIVFLTALFSTGVFVATTLTKGRQSLQEISLESVRNLAQSSYNYVSSYLDERRKDLIDFAGNKDEIQYVYDVLNSDEEGRAAAVDSLNANMKELFSHDDNYVFGFILDSEGQAICATEDELMADWSHREYYKEGKHGAFISDVFMSAAAAEIAGRSGQIPIMVVSAPVKMEGRLLGVAVFALNFEGISAFVTAQKVGETGESYLVRSDGKLASMLTSDSMEMQVLKSDLSGVKGVQEVLRTKASGHSDEPYVDYEGEKVYGTWHWLEGANMALVAEIDEAEILSPVIEQTLIGGLSALLIMIIAVIAGVVVGGKIAQPLHVFEELMSNAARGNLDSEFPMPQFNCSDMKGCGKESCPSYDDPDHLCFIDAGSYAPDFGKEINCPAILAGTYKDCTECDLFHDKAKDEVLRLGAWYNAFLRNLKDIIGKVLDGTEQIAQSSDEISSGNQDLSSRTEEQAASLEETASSMEEMSSALSETSSHAVDANEFAKKAQDATGRGVAAINRTSEQVKALNAASEQIADITKIIEDIAFQTNILALNAAVEAARAGEQGRGFAVVASEVRNLAQNTSKSVKDIDSLIQDIVDKTSKANEDTDDTAKVLSEIEEKVEKVAEILNEISSASVEQQNGVEQVNKAVSEMDEVTQKNAALVEEAASASEEMSSQASEVAELVRFFTIDGDKGEKTKKIGKTDVKALDIHKNV